MLYVMKGSESNKGHKIAVEEVYQRTVNYVKDLHWDMKKAKVWVHLGESSKEMLYF